MHRLTMLTRVVLCVCLFAGVALVASLGCGGDDTSASANSCNFDSDCSLGQVCGAGSTCVTAACDLCEYENGQVCYRTEENPQGSCSAPECNENDDCADKGGTCSGGLCTDQECETSADCTGANEICNLANECVESDGTCMSTQDCLADQICTESNICRPGCEKNEDCEESEFCDREGENPSQTCQTGCRSEHDCASTQECSDNRCVCTPGTCGAGNFCNEASGACEEATSCDQISCPEEEVCDPTTLGCVASCTPDSCDTGQVCNQSTGQCIIDTCLGEDPSQCEGNAQRPLWDPVKCFCAECVDDSDCNMAAGESCNASCRCFSCETTCDSATPGTCAGETPYCVDSCCNECIGAADCPGDELCLEGFCGQPPNCSTDPSICPAGTTCDMTTGRCESGQSGGACSEDDPTSCPMGQFCDPTTNTCQGVGGDFGCGLCNPDCTCDGGLTCDGFFCTGCEITVVSIIPPETSDNCPGDQFCLPFGGGICFGG